MPNNNNKLITPFGLIEILIDGKPIPYTAVAGKISENLCPDLLGRYQISVSFVPDGSEHSIACIFRSEGSYERSPESGERLECQSFYSADRFKMSIGVEGDIALFDGKHPSGDYDYDVDYLENGMAFLILPDTKTDKYIFGIAWIDDVGFDDRSEGSEARDVQTWYGADPSIPL